VDEPTTPGFEFMLPLVVEPAMPVALLPVVPAPAPGWLARLLRSSGTKGDQPPIPSIFEVFNTALDIVEQRVARSRLAGEPADVLITPLLPNFGTMEYHRAREAIREGRAAVERMAPLIEQVVPQ
jgi:NTE family protein